MTDVCTRGVDTGFVALGYVKVTVLGVVQGITELLPISSTATCVWFLRFSAGPIPVQHSPPPCSLRLLPQS